MSSCRGPASAPLGCPTPPAACPPIAASARERVPSGPDADCRAFPARGSLRGRDFQRLCMRGNVRGYDRGRFCKRGNVRKHDRGRFCKCGRAPGCGWGRFCKCGRAPGRGWGRFCKCGRAPSRGWGRFCKCGSVRDRDPDRFCKCRSKDDYKCDQLGAWSGINQGGGLFGHTSRNDSRCATEPCRKFEKTPCGPVAR